MIGLENYQKMLKVLHVVTHMNRGGLETMIMNYYRKIDKTRIQFDFLVHREYRGDYDDEIEFLGGTIYRLSRLNPFSRVYRKELADFFDKHSEYQIVHVHQDCLSSIILKEANKHGVPVRVAHSHSSNQDKNLKYLIKLFYRLFIPKYATNLLACGYEAGNWMFRGANFQVLNNAIDAQTYSFCLEKREKIRKEFGIEKNSMVIGHVGRFSPVKNHDYLIDVFNMICKKKDAILLLVGDGELRSQMEQKVKQLNLKNRVIFTGIRSDVTDLLQAMDVFVFPSYYEGLPVTLIEAQASGLPCIISDKIPEECKITNLIKQISLDESVDIWADEIINAVQIERLDTFEEIKNSGFDICQNTKKLEEFYFGELKSYE